VYSRVTSFLSTLYGDFAAIKDEDLNVVVITHGLTLRLVRSSLPPSLSLSPSLPLRRFRRH